VRDVPNPAGSLGGLPAKHSLLLYASEDEFLAPLVPFVLDGIAAGDAVIAVAATANLRALRATVGPAPPSVRFVEGRDWYAHGPDTVGRWTSFIDDQCAVGRPVTRIVGEVVWPDDVRLHWEMTRVEAAATCAFDPRPTLVVCPYNKTLLPAAVVEAAVATHPGVIEDGAAYVSGTHVPPAQLVRAALPRLPVPDGVEAVRFEPADVVSAAAFVELQARRAGLEEHRVQSLVSAASELVLNGFVHAGTAVHLAIWTDDHDVVCQVDDEGPGIDDPSVGYHPPGGADTRWGLWLARRRTDAIEPGWGERGFAVRVRMHRAPRPGWPRAQVASL
jgi:anti-sigma regulatory factor (Ser/Thr protein kinase)